MNSTNTDEKIEEYETQLHIQLHKTIKIEFVQPDTSDYMDCQSDNHDLSNCNAIKRILHVLIHYHQYGKNAIYEHLSSLPKYDMSIFMEDWYQTKKYHLRRHGVEWIRNELNQVDIKCDGPNTCQHNGRYGRQQANDVFSMGMDMDSIKNIDLVNQLHSIHMFIFHSRQREMSSKTGVKIQYKHYDEKEEKMSFISNKGKVSKHSTSSSNSQSIDRAKIEDSFWNNEPDCIFKCNLKQIIWLINKILDEPIQKNMQKLTPYKTDIITYTQQRKYNGEQLVQQLNRKRFCTEIINYLNLKNEQLSTSLVLLHSEIMKLEDHQRNVDKIETIIDDIITNENQLFVHKSEIIAYFQKRYDSEKLMQMQEKAFAAKFISHLNSKNKKINSPLAQLYTAIISYNISSVWADVVHKNEFITECNVHQISCVVDHIISNKMSQFISYKQKIVNYIKNDKVDGNKLSKMSTNDFIDKITECLGKKDLKSTLPFGSLYKNIMECCHCDSSIYVAVKTDKISSSKQTNLSNDKFSTTIENSMYYSFGTPYKYTNNLEKHPFYVKPKYNNIKMEVDEYFRRIQDNQVLQQLLLDRQLEKIQNSLNDVDVNAHPILRSLTKICRFKDILWDKNDIELKYIDSLSALLDMEYNTYGEIMKIMMNIIDREDEIVIQQSYSTLEKSLEKQFETVQQNIKQYLKNYVDQLNTSDVIQYYSKIKEYINEINHEYKSNTLINIITDALNMYGNVFNNKELKQYEIERENALLDYIQNSVSDKTCWMKTFFQAMEEELDEAEMVVDIFYEIIRIPKHIFYSKCVQQQSLNDQHSDSKYMENSDYDLHGIFMQICSQTSQHTQIKDFNLKSQHVQCLNKILKNIIVFNETKYVNSILLGERIIEHNAADILSSIMIIEDMKCNDFISILKDYNKNNVIRMEAKTVLPMLTNLLLIKMAKIKQLYRMKLVTLSQTEQNNCKQLSVLITKINYNLKQTQIVKNTNFVFVYYFQTLLKTQFENIQSLKKLALGKYHNMVQF
eukprot:380342_1